MEKLVDVDQQKFLRVQKRVKAISTFYRHLALYILVNVFLIGIQYYNLSDGEDFLTFQNFTPAFFWGLGLVCHAVAVFGDIIFFDHAWEESKIREIMAQEKQQKWE